jgi:hypothetical protein
LTMQSAGPRNARPAPLQFDPPAKPVPGYPRLTPASPRNGIRLTNIAASVPDSKPRIASRGPSWAPPEASGTGKYLILMSFSIL